MMFTIANRIHTLLLLLLVLMAGAIIAMLATRAYGGPLDPTGPPAATDGVRGPGTPISSLPFVITMPGYYYVTRPLTGGTSQSGITVSSSNVTIDLGGFTLGGGTFAVQGIDVEGFRNVAIQNGSIRGWSTGILAVGCSNCRVDHVQASSNTLNGISMDAQSEISDCNASLNGQYGIVANNITVRNCTFSENGTTAGANSGNAGILVQNGSLIEGNRLNSNVGRGIEVTGNNNTFRNNELSSNCVVQCSVFVGRDMLFDAGTVGNVDVENAVCSWANHSVNAVGGPGDFSRPGC